ncbi:MAG TPA: DUF308 domain-containing protein [Methanomicrobiales archaeon]|nr:DUF308 domain-containing protein [Methanomicrobiales archaeon]
MSETEVLEAPMIWQSFVLRGILALITGFLVLLWPGIAVLAVVILFGVLLLVASIQTLYFASKVPKGLPQPVVPIVTAVIGLVLGIVALVFPWITAVALTWLIAALMMWMGLIEIASAVFHPEFMKHPVLFGLSGAVGVVLGGIFLFYPGLGAQVLVMVYFGFFALLYGILSIAIGLQVKGEEKVIEKKAAA